MAHEKRINSLVDLHHAALSKRSVRCLGPGMLDKPSPAAFVMNMQGHVLVRLIYGRTMVIHQPKRKRRG